MKYSSFFCFFFFPFFLFESLSPSAAEIAIPSSNTENFSCILPIAQDGEELEALYRRLDPHIASLNSPSFPVRETARGNIEGIIADYLCSADQGSGRAPQLFSQYDKIIAWFDQCQRRATSLELARRIQASAQEVRNSRRAKMIELKERPLRKIVAQISRKVSLLTDMIDAIESDFLREIDGNTGNIVNAFEDLESTPAILDGYNALLERIIQNLRPFSCVPTDPTFPGWIRCEPDASLLNGPVDPFSSDVSIEANLGLSLLIDGGGLRPLIRFYNRSPGTYPPILIDLNTVPNLSAAELADALWIGGVLSANADGVIAEPVSPLPVLRLRISSRAGNRYYYERYRRNDVACGGPTPFEAYPFVNGGGYVTLIGENDNARDPHPICTLHNADSLPDVHPYSTLERHLLDLFTALPAPGGQEEELSSGESVELENDPLEGQAAAF